MLKRSIFKVLAILASLMIGLLTLATPASAKILEDFPPSASVITTSGYLNNAEIENIKKQTMQGSKKVVSVYLTDESVADVEQRSMDIFEAWQIPEDQILFYYEYETEKYNWVAGSEADNFGAAQMRYSMSQAQKYFDKGDVASGISVAVSFSKLQLADPSIFVTGNEAKDAENPIKNGSFFGVFGKVFIGVIVSIIIIAIIASILANKRVSAAAANIKEKVSEAKANASDSSKGYVEAAEENYNARKKQVQEILEAERAKSAGSLAIVDDSSDNSSNSGASDVFEGGYGSDSDNMNSTGYDYDLTGKKNESPADIFGNWGVNDKNKSNDDDPFGKPTNDIFKL